MGCKNRKKKEEMIRFIRDSGGRLIIDKMKNLKGRGFYLCPDIRCLKKAQKNKNMVWAIGIDGSPVSLMV